MKMRFLRSMRSPSSTISRMRGSAAAQSFLKSFVGGSAMPPMRPNECVRRAPVSSSRMSHTISRALMNQRNGVNAPSSMAMAPSHVRWSADARELAERHAVPLAALGHGDAAQLLDRERVADVVQHRRHVVEPVDVREDLRPRPALAHLLEAAVQIADLHVALHDRLARELEHHAHGAVHRGMRRPHVQVHRLGGKLELPLVQLDVERLHVSCPPQRGCGAERPKGIPSSGPNGSMLLEGQARFLLGPVRDERLRSVRRVRLLERMPLELRVHEDAAQVRVAAEAHAAHVEDLALQPVDPRPDGDQAVELRAVHVLVAHARLQADAVALGRPSRGGGRPPSAGARFG